MASVVLIGNTTVDIVAAGITRHPGWAKDVSLDNVAILNQPVQLYPAGNGAGAALAYARLCGARPGPQPAESGSVANEVALLSLVGRDLLGDYVRRELAAAGVDVVGLRATEDVRTDATIVWVDTSGGRSLAGYPGTAMRLGLEHIDLAAVRQGRVLLIGGYLLLVALFGPPAVTLLRAARESGLTTVLDIVPPVLPRRTAADLADVLALVDVFVPNALEAMLLTGKQDPAAAAVALQEYGPRRVLITLGEQGVLVADGPKRTHVPAHRVEVVNPTGAGDAFNAGLCYGLVRGHELMHSVRFACAAGALTASQPLGVAGVPAAADVERFMTEGKR